MLKISPTIENWKIHAIYADTAQTTSRYDIGIKFEQFVSAAMTNQNLQGLLDMDLNHEMKTLLIEHEVERKKKDDESDPDDDVVLALEHTVSD